MPQWEKKLRLYKTTDVQRDKYLRRGHPCESLMSLDVKISGEVGWGGRVRLCVYVLVIWVVDE